MTKGPGQKHFQREDHEHAAHQAESARPEDHDAAAKGRTPDGKGNAKRDGHPAEETPKSPRKGQ